MNDTPDKRRTFPIGSKEGRDEAERRIAEALRDGATELDLGGLGLEEIPASLLQHTQLRMLYLGLGKEAADKSYHAEEDKNACNAVRLSTPNLL